jgi:RNA polymerase sigma factor (sigma-70 family)
VEGRPIGTVDPADHIGICWDVAKKYAWTRDRLDELANVGMLGVIRAVQKFDPTRGVKFNTYAYFWVKAEIRRHILANARLVRPSYADCNQMFKSGELFKKEIPLDAPLTSQLCKRFKLEAERERTLHDVVADTDAKTPEAEAELSERSEKLQAAIGALPAKWQEVVRRRFVLEESLQEIGDSLGCTREWVRQIELKALKALRERLAGRLEVA